MNKRFWVDPFRNNIKTYRELLRDINNNDTKNEYISSSDPYIIFVSLLHSIINNYPVVIIDSEYSQKELKNLGLNKDLINKKEEIEQKELNGIEELINDIANCSPDWRIGIYTSGTTGDPKKIEHTYRSITKAVMISDKHSEDTWGFAYNPTHIAGIQVFFQAFLNINTLINIFATDFNRIVDIINNSQITHISATPTYYRLLLSTQEHFYNIAQVTCGGEKLTNNLKRQIRKFIPNARILNVYASTEAGTLFASKGEEFIITDDIKNFIKVENGELHIHQELLGESNVYNFSGNWYSTGDLVEIVDYTPLKIKFIGRKGEVIKVGGYKVQPTEIEEALLKQPSIKSARVYSQKNSVLGNIICAEVVAENISEHDIRNELSKILQPYKIPRMIDIVDEITTTRTGKTKR